jgi:PAS domain S-box-containing protein
MDGDDNRRNEDTAAAATAAGGQRDDAPRTLREELEELHGIRVEFQRPLQELRAGGGGGGRDGDEQRQGARKAVEDELAAVLASTDIAALFVDTDFRVRRYTPAVAALLHLTPDDVGRPLAEVPRAVDDPHLDADLHAVLDRLAPIEREVAGHNGRHYTRRTLAYRTADNRIDGVVVTFVDVTERVVSAHEAGRALYFAESIVEAIHEPLLVLNTDLTVHSVNPAFYRLFRVAAVETIGRKVYDLGNGQWDIPALRTALEEVLPANKAFDDYEVIHAFDDIGRRVMLLNGRQLDHVQLILLGIRDVTGQHGAEAVLREGGTWYRMLVDNLHDYAILRTDLNGAITEWTEGARRVTGYTAGEAVGRHVSLIYTPEQVADGAVDREFAEAAKTGRAEREDWRVRKGGERFWGNEIVTAIRDADGRVTSFAKITRDLGGQRWMEKELRVSQERFRIVADHVEDYGIFMADASGIITSWNPGAEHIFGYTRDEAIGLDARVLFTPEDQATGEQEKELELARQQGRASDDRWQMRKGGERFWAAGVTSAMRDSAGTVIGFIKILRDETQRKQLEEQLRTTNEALEERVADRTASIVTHQGQLRSLVAELGRSEIRQRRMLATELHDNLAQILAACKLKVSSIEAQLPGNSKSRQDAAIVKESLGEAISYTRALMTDLRPDVLDEHDLQAAIEWVAKRMARHGLKVEVSDDAQPKPIDQEVLGFLFQAVRELLWNVVKHARTTEAAVTIQRRDNDVAITVEDAGIGFDVSRQLVPSEKGGFGLFSIAERIGLLGGRMDAQSLRRKGTLITLIVPIDTPTPDSSTGEADHVD